jgi:mono/diheme cytochrome c family protein
MHQFASILEENWIAQPEIYSMNSNRVFLCAMALVVLLPSCGGEEAVTPSQGTDAAVAVNEAKATTGSTDERFASGKKLYAAHCAACHQSNGQGLAGAFPPLAESSYLAEGAGPAITAVVNGLSGPITVNGADYDAVMPGMSYLDDEEVAKIVTFVMNSWNNPGGVVSAADVAATRDGGGL